MSSDTNILVSLSDAMAAAVVKAGAATVMVSGRSRHPASGIAMAPDLVLTADHVLERDEDILIGLPDGSEVKARTAGRDPGSDIAVLRLEKAVLVAAERAPQAARVGQFALALGRPGSDGIQASLGIVSAISAGRGGMLERFLRTDATPYPGFSGGPLVDASGQILGMNTSGFAPGTSLTIPAEIAWQVAETLAAHGHIRRGYLGIRSQPVELNDAAQGKLGRKQESGLLIVGLERDGAALASGMMIGDILVSIAGQAVEDADTLLSRLTGDIVGQKTAVQVLRGGEPTALSVVVGERSERGERR